MEGIGGKLRYLKRVGSVSSCPEGGNPMAETRVRKNENIDTALRRFKRTLSKEGTMAEVRKRKYYEKPSVKRKKKSEAARKRKY